MSTEALKHDALRPRQPGGMGRGLSLALLVHAGLIVAIAFGVNWRTSDPAGVEAELWANVPQIAAPKPVEPEPVPQPKKPEPPPPPPPKAEPVQQTPDAQIAIEKAKREEEKRKEEARREEEKRKEDAKRAEQQRLKEEQDRKKEEAERKKKEAEAARKDAERLAAARDAQMKRLSELAGATGDPSSTGNAARTAGPSAGYAGRIKARILPNIVFTEGIDGNPVATVEVRAAPDGTIIGRRLIKSSGVKAWDDAVLRAIDKTEVLPRDTDGRVPSSFEISFRVRE
jgi:colicin import membrane protein